MPWTQKRARWRNQDVAGAYDARRFRGPTGRLKHARDAALVLRLLAELGPAGTVLDLPGGTGRLWPDLRAAGHRVLACDLSRAMLVAAGERRDAAALALEAEAERLPLAEDAVDAVCSLRFLFHIEESAARARILREMARVARRGVIGEVRWGATWKHASRRARRHTKLRPAYAREALERELAEAGLVLTRVEPLSRFFSDKALFLARPR